jgi:hypothetical protein
LEEWEIQVAAELRLDKPETYYMRSKDKKSWGCRVTTQSKWDAENTIYAVPEDFSVMPTCRDCWKPTEIADIGNGYYVVCNPKVIVECTIGPTKPTKAEAVKAYPKGE